MTGAAAAPIISSNYVEKECRIADMDADDSDANAEPNSCIIFHLIQKGMTHVSVWRHMGCAFCVFEERGY